MAATCSPCAGRARRLRTSPSRMRPGRPPGQRPSHRPSATTANVGNTAPSFYWLNGLTDAPGKVTLYTTYGNGGGGNSGPGFLFSLDDANGFNAPIGTGGSHSDALVAVASVPTGSNQNFR